MGAGGGQALVPGGKVPQDGRDQQSEDHRKAGARADLQDELDRQQVDDGVGHQAGAEQHADEVHNAGVDNGDVRLQRVGVDAGGDGVGGVVEAVDELKAQRDEEREAQQQERQHRWRVHQGEIGGKAMADVEQADEQHDREGDGAPLAGGGLSELAVKQRALGLFQSDDDWVGGRRGHGRVPLSESSWSEVLDATKSSRGNVSIVSMPDEL